MSVEPRALLFVIAPTKKGGKGEMTKTPISLQDLRRSLYVKAKAEPAWRFWGLNVHVCKLETLHEAYGMAKSNNGAPGIDGVTFEALFLRSPLRLASAMAVVQRHVHPGVAHDGLNHCRIFLLI